MAHSRKHVLFLPFPAYGHITPLFQLAIKTSTYHNVTFALSKNKLDGLRRRGFLDNFQDEQADAGISFFAIEDPVLEEEDDRVSIFSFSKNWDRDGLAVADFIKSTQFAGVAESESKPSIPTVDLLIMDYILTWVGTVPALEERQIPLSLYCSSQGFIFSNKLNVDDNTPTIPDEAFFSPWENYPDVSVTGIPEHWKKPKLGQMQRPLKLVTSFIFNTLAVLEPECMEIMENHPLTRGKPLYCVAPLFLDKEPERENGKVLTKFNEVEAWLNRQQNRSVIYISFGSMAVPDIRQVNEIAKALFSSNKPFIWSLRNEEQQSLPADILDKIAHQYSSASKFLILDWAPQTMILKHPATKVFVSHVGWNSTMESLGHGIPIVAWPMFGDQFWNAVLVDKLKVGLVLPDTTLLFSKILLADQILAAIVEVGGWNDDHNSPRNTFFENARKVGEIFLAAAASGGNSEMAIKKFLNF